MTANTICLWFHSEAQAAAEKLVAAGHKMLVVKSQIHAGGRGKGTFKSGFKGGVKLCKTAAEAKDLATAMLDEMPASRPHDGDAPVARPQQPIRPRARRRACGGRAAGKMGDDKIAIKLHKNAGGGLAPLTICRYKTVAGHGGRDGDRNDQVCCSPRCHEAQADRDEEENDHADADARLGDL